MTAEGAALSLVPSFPLGKNSSCAVRASAPAGESVDQMNHPAGVVSRPAYWGRGVSIHAAWRGASR